MNKTRRYEFDGMVIDIPIYFDEQAKMYIEDYPDFIENPVWTPNGNRVLFSGTDACENAERASLAGCPDCAACKHFRPADEKTWFGICSNEKNKKENIISKGEN